MDIRYCAPHHRTVVAHCRNRLVLTHRQHGLAIGEEEEEEEEEGEEDEEHHGWT